MQIKKDEVKQKLLDAARHEFMEQGFEGASIRSIVKTANTTIGNFYNYFQSKEAIFTALVKDIYNGFSYILSNHNNIPLPDLEHELDMYNLDIALLRSVLAELIGKVLYILNSSFILLIEKSHGTKYENSKQELIDMMSEHFLLHISEESPGYPNPEIGKILARQMLEGIMEILKTYKNFDEKLQMLTELTIFVITGMVGILKGEKND